jgi:hypothetical protein
MLFGVGGWGEVRDGRIGGQRVRIRGVCVYYYSSYYKAVRVGGGG